MLIQRIKAENYKTYLHLDLDLSVTDDKSIILIGGVNGGGKTTLFEAIYSALYGLKIDSVGKFRELFNAGVKDYENKPITLEISFTGLVLGTTQHYRLRRVYKIINGKPAESVQLDFGGSTYTYGSATPLKQRSLSEQVVDSIISANLPRDLSTYFLFDAMKTSELVKEGEINNLIRNNINSVMGFNKYIRLQMASEKLLSDEKAKRMEDENQAKAYKELTLKIQLAESQLVQLKSNYDKVLQYSNDNKDLYVQAKKGADNEAVAKSKLENVKKKLQNLKRAEQEYRSHLDNTIKGLESDVIIPKLAFVIAHEIEQILNVKDGIEESKKNRLNEEQISTITHQVVDIIKKHYDVGQDISIKGIVDEIIYNQEDPQHLGDKYYYLDRNDVDTLKEFVKTNGNPMLQIDEQKRNLDMEVEEEPRLREDVVMYQQQISGNNYAIIKLYEDNEQKIYQIKGQIDQKLKDIEQMRKEMQKYDYQVRQEPDPKFETLQKLPDYFKKLSSNLLHRRKHDIEQKMREYLNVNMVSYKNMIGRVDLSQKPEDDEIQFKIYHISGNEISLNQLNAGSKQMVMQVLLKVLYELGDYDPPVMIDTVMGVLDRASRETILKNYFPDLSRQTILLSTDTEIEEKDFSMLKPYISKVYTLHRDLEKQCTTITEDYFDAKL